MINEKKVRRYCADDITKIENYDKAISSSEIWHCHHRREIEDGIIRGVNDLKQEGLYYKRPASELVFMTLSEHRILHNKNRSEDTRRKIGEAHKGKQGNRLGVKLSEETRRKMSDAKKEDTIQKSLVGKLVKQILADIIQKKQERDNQKQLKPIGKENELNKPPLLDVVCSNIILMV